MGIWRSHHSIGNIAGSLIAGAFVEYSWGLSFAVPAVIIFSLGLLTFAFLVPDPRAVGCPVPVHNIELVIVHFFLQFASCTRQSFFQTFLFQKPNDQEIVATEDGNNKEDDKSESSVSESSSDSHSNKEDEKAISFWRAVRIPVSFHQILYL